jgi:uncharacterized protein (DUF983 family)
MDDRIVQSQESEEAPGRHGLRLAALAPHLVAWGFVILVVCAGIALAAMLVEASMTDSTSKVLRIVMPSFVLAALGVFTVALLIVGLQQDE